MQGAPCIAWLALAAIAFCGNAPAAEWAGQYRAHPDRPGTSFVVEIQTYTAPAAAAAAAQTGMESVEQAIAADCHRQADPESLPCHWLSLPLRCQQDDGSARSACWVLRFSPALAPAGDSTTGDRPMVVTLLAPFRERDYPRLPEWKTAVAQKKLECLFGWASALIVCRVAPNVALSFGAAGTSGGQESFVSQSGTFIAALSHPTDLVKEASP